MAGLMALGLTLCVKLDFKLSRKLTFHALGVARLSQGSILLEADSCRLLGLSSFDGLCHHTLVL